MLGEPQRRQFSGGENDERLSEGAESLAQHHHQEHEIRTVKLQRAEEAQQCSEHVQPGSQDQLWRQRSKGQRAESRAHRKLRPNKDPVCTVIRKPNVSNSHVVPKLRGIATSMKTTDNQLMSSRETLRYWADWAATGANDSHIWEDETDPNKKNWVVTWLTWSR